MGEGRDVALDRIQPLLERAQARLIAALFFIEPINLLDNLFKIHA
jgi:hypothetical protein